MLNVTNREEVQRGRHLAVQYEEDNRFYHQQEGDDHFTTRGTFQTDGFFGENHDDTQCDDAQHHTCDALVVQQPGGDGDQHHHASDGRQQFAHVHWGKVRFRTVLFYPFLAESKVNNRDHHPHHAEGKRHAPAEASGQPRGCQHREERTDVDGHVVHGECTVQTGIVFVIAGRKQGGRVGFEQAVTDGDGRHTHIDDGSIMAGPGHQRIADGQHDSAQHDDTFGAQHFIAQPAANSNQTIDQRAKGGEQSNGIRFRHTQLFYQVNGHDPLQAVITKTLP